MAGLVLALPPDAEQIQSGHIRMEIRVSAVIVIEIARATWCADGITHAHDYQRASTHSMHSTIVQAMAVVKYRKLFETTAAIH
jgi:hypothetical protein